MQSDKLNIRHFKMKIKNLDDLLDQRNISKAAFARMMSTSAQNVQNWCNRGVPAIKALEVASKLGIPVSEVSAMGSDDSGLDLDFSQIDSAREAVGVIIELGLLKNLSQRELGKLIGLLDNLPSSEGKE